jgi:hypothetical protein
MGSRLQDGLCLAHEAEHNPGGFQADSLIGALEGLRRFLGGQKATLVWDGLPAHRSQAMRRWLAS